MTGMDPIQTTDLCRYCLMCRHVCPVTTVTHNEITSPHGWGTLISSVERGLALWTEDAVDRLYQCADCGLCRSHCVTDQPLPLAINLTRATVVTDGHAPPAVARVSEKLQRWQNPYVEQSPEVISGEGESALLIGAAAKYLRPQSVEAVQTLLAAVGVDPVPVAVGRSSANLANTLGLTHEAQTLARATLDEIARVKARRVFVLSPAEVYTFETVLPHLGLELPSGVEVVEVSVHLAEQLDASRIRKNGLTDYGFVDPDHTVRNPGRWAHPRTLLAALTDAEPVELFWRRERAVPTGVSGGLTFTQPELARRLAEVQIQAAIERGARTLVTDDPHTAHHLSQVAAGSDITVAGLFELLAENLVAS